MQSEAFFKSINLTETELSQQHQIKLNYTNPESNFFVANSLKMHNILTIIKKVAQVPVSVLLMGESGVGKEMVAKTIHQLGPRSDKPFIQVNCGAIPINLLESELFGYKRGAFTGADPKGKIGYFMQADKGVLLLDEISELPFNMQVKLLRVLQERRVTPVGGTESESIDMQVIAAANDDLEKMVNEGTFREDLYYRLNVVPIHIPPLRERPEDITILTSYFLDKFNSNYKKQIKLTSNAIDFLKTYPWYGNVRELENVIERVVVTSENELVDLHSISKYISWKKKLEKIEPIIRDIMTLKEAIDSVEEQLITMAMEKFKSEKLAGQALGVSQATISRKYMAIRERLKTAQSETMTKNEIIEGELDKQLKSVAIVTSVSLEVEEIKELLAKVSLENPVYHKLQKKLTMIRDREGNIEWNYIWKVTEDGRIINLVSDKKLEILPGEEYVGPTTMMEAAFAAMKGTVVVTPKYIDKFGAWKSSLSPICDEMGKVIVILGSDYSVEFVNRETLKLSEMLNFK